MSDRCGYCCKSRDCPIEVDGWTFCGDACKEMFGLGEQWLKSSGWPEIKARIEGHISAIDRTGKHGSFSAAQAMHAAAQELSKCALDMFARAERRIERD